MTLIEECRLKIQSTLDKEKDLKNKAERNLLGQFATPTDLAREVVTQGLMYAGNSKIKFLDPAFGTGSFYSALINSCSSDLIVSAMGFEIDEHYGVPAQSLWNNYALHLEISDFTLKKPTKTSEKANFLICNPPYVRHHHLDKETKERLCLSSESVFKVNTSALSGLYCHFIACAHKWMEEEALAGWLIPSEFMDVNYGKSLKHYLLNEVTLLNIHRYSPDEAKFDDALVSSAVVWFKNKKPKKGHTVNFSFGGTLAEPECSKSVTIETLKNETKWTRFPLKDERKIIDSMKISDFFKIKRGLATGNNKFFIVSEADAKEKNIPKKFLRPILPSPRYLIEKEIQSREDGAPNIDKVLYLIDCTLPPHEVEEHYPSLWQYLQHGVDLGVNEAYLCKNRTFWYKQEKRESAPFYCTYIGRDSSCSNKPFNFILNHSEAIVTNSYLALEPLPHIRDLLSKHKDLRVKVWKALNSICDEKMKEEGRVYGGGMHKMEPKELANVPANELARLLNRT